jgi:hypothetical protein
LDAFPEPQPLVPTTFDPFPLSPDARMTLTVTAPAQTDYSVDIERISTQTSGDDLVLVRQAKFVVGFQFERSTAGRPHAFSAVKREGCRPRRRPPTAIHTPSFGPTGRRGRLGKPY